MLHRSVSRPARTPLGTARILIGGALLALLSGPALAAAQSAEPVPSGAVAGYELLLSGPTTSERGHPFALVGVGYEVEGLARLTARPGLEVVARLTARADRRTRRTVAEGRATTGAGGRFSLALPVPTETLATPRLEITVGRPGTPPRAFVFPFSQTSDEALELLTDRNRYQPGETVRAWLRVRGARQPSPRPNVRVRLTLRNQSGEELAQAEGRTTASGALVADLELPDGAPVGPYLVRAEQIESGVSTQRAIQVWRRTVERILARVELRGGDDERDAMVRPGGPLRGRVVVTTPSGTPIRGASVELRVRADAEPTSLTTDAEGYAAFDVRAPVYLAGEVGHETVSARVVHPAHGTIVASARYLMARVTAVVDAVARGGALVPEVPTTLYLDVHDPRGRPLPSGTEIALRGAGIAGVATGTLDAGGFAEVSVELPRGGATTMRGGACAGRVAATFEVEIRSSPPRFSRLCVPVSVEAEVAPRVDGAPVTVPGAPLAVELARRPGARGRAVLVEALFGGRSVASVWVDGRATRATLEVPPDLLGTLTLRARALREANDSEPASEPGTYALGPGAYDAVLVRPADAFSLEVSPAQERYLVRERAAVTVSASVAPARGWTALLARDQAAHGGEGDWDLYWMRGALHAALAGPADRANARMIRAALAASMGIDPEGPAPAPLEPPYWEPNRHRPYHSGAQVGRGVLRDPVALREEMLRRGLGPIMQRLEGLVGGLGTEPAARAPIVTARGARMSFHSDVLAHLVSQRQLAASQAVTLGGEPLTVAMVQSADPSFSFDAVARRVTRQRLSRLLTALLRLTHPDDANAQRASANLPPERWLGTLVQLGMVQARDLTDPWGRAFVFRRVTGRRPTLAVSERALEWELASPGPDGRLNTADDVNDPFARAVTEGSPYAVISGEEALMRRLSMLAPAAAVLQRMSTAYVRLALAAQEEMRATTVTASSTEADEDGIADDLDEAEAPEEAASGESYGVGGLDMAGGGGGGYGRGEPRRSRSAASAPPPAPTVASADAEPMMEAMASRAQGGEAPSRATAMGAMIREDFPATLFFVGEVPLENGRAVIEVPLADALTTYRLEAIAWTSGGWTTSASARVRVDQRALVDAPVPPFATAGDVVRLPIRVENRTDDPLPVRIQIEAEGELAFTPGEPGTATIPPHEAREVLASITLPDAGEGSLVVSVAEQGGGPLDAVRRPIRVLADARTVRERRQQLVDGTATIELPVPAEASARAPGQLRVAVGARLFGSLEGANTMWSAWALTLSGEALGEAREAELLAWLTYEDHERDRLRSPEPSALALSVLWADRRVSDDDARRALRSIGQNLPAREVVRQMPPEGIGEQPLQLLLALAPMARRLGARPAVAEDARALLDRLRQLTSSYGAAVSDAPTVWAGTAAALAFTPGGEARAQEMVRRASRHRVRVADMAWLEPEQPRGSEPRALPTALLALAELGLGRRQSALQLLRSLVAMQRAQSEGDPVATVRAFIQGELIAPAPPSDDPRAHAIAAAAAGLLAPGSDLLELRVTLDGVRLEGTTEGGVFVATLPAIATPGAHALVVHLPTGSLALAQLAFSYGMPWDVPPVRTAPIVIEASGELGARDTRAALTIEVRNESARILSQPVVELELPAGAELDEPTREALAAHLVGDAHQEGRTLILPLRPLAPGGWVRLPLPARWSVAGTLRGLGAVAYDALGPDDAASLPVAVLPTRVIELADEGPEPEAPDAEASAPPRPMPPPLPILERLVPEEN